MNELDTSFQTHQNAVEKINAQNKLANELRNTDAQRGLSLAKSTEEDARQIDYRAGLAAALVNQMNCYRMLGDIANALKAAKNALEIAHELGDKVQQAQILQAQGFTYSTAGDYAKGLENQQKALTLNQEVDDQPSIARSLTFIGIAHSMGGNYEQACEYYRRSIEKYTALNDIFGCAVAFNSCCVDYTKLGDYERAEDYGEKAVEHFLQVDDQRGAAIARSSLGEVALAQGSFDRAIYHFDQALRLFGAGNLELTAEEALETQLNLSKAYISIEAYEKSLEYLLFVYKHAETHQMQHYLMRSHELLADLYEGQNDLKSAIQHLKKYTQIREKLLNETSKRDLSNLQIIHETQQAFAESERQRTLREQERQNFDRITRLKDEFMHGATHDMKNPLTVIGMSTYLIKQFIPEDQHKAQEHLQIISSSVQKIRRLVEDILDLARLETMPNIEFETVSIKALIDQVVSGIKPLADSKQITVEIRVLPENLAARVNQQRLLQAIGNLISNAVKYTPEAGTILLKAAIIDDVLEIQVIDNGIGIPEEAVPFIYDRFYRVHKKNNSIEGTGLGLSIVKECIDQQGGSIHVKSKLGTGTTFTVTIPQK